MELKHLIRNELAQLERITGVSPIIFRPGGWDLLDFLRYYYDFLEQQYNFAVLTGIPHSKHEKDGRLGVAYEFEYGQQFGAIIAGELSLATAVRQLFFVTHGFGHGIQHLDPARREFIEKIIDPASDSIGSRRPDELVEWRGEYKTFSDWFTPFEIETTRIGSRALFEALRSYCVDRQIVMDSSQYQKIFDDLVFLMNLYVDIDHPYHNSTIAGDFAPEDWLGNAGKKLFYVVIVPHKARLSIGAAAPDSFKKEIPRIVNIRGSFVEPSSADFAALWSYRKNILGHPDNDITAVAGHALPLEIVRLPDGAPLVECPRIMRTAVRSDSSIHRSISPLSTARIA